MSIKGFFSFGNFWLKQLCYLQNLLFKECFIKIMSEKLHKLHKNSMILLKLAIEDKYATKTLREKCPNTEFFLVRIFLYSDWIQENMDQKKLRIWTLFTHCLSSNTPKILLNWGIHACSIAVDGHLKYLLFCFVR